MKWSKVRKLHPNKYVFIEFSESHIVDNFKYIDEVDVLDVIEDDVLASKVLSKCRGNRLVYHTSKEKICMEIVRRY